MAAGKTQRAPRHAPRPRFDEGWDEDPNPWGIGSACTLSPYGGTARERAFPPGFHGAAPGPSHPEADAPPKRRRQRRATPAAEPTKE